MAADKSKPPRVSEILYRPDKETLTLLHQTYEKQQVLFLKLQAVLVEVQQLRADQTSLARLVLSALAVADAPPNAQDYETLKQISHKYPEK